MNTLLFLIQVDVFQEVEFIDAAPALHLQGVLLDLKLCCDAGVEDRALFLEGRRDFFCGMVAWRMGGWKIREGRLVIIFLEPGQQAFVSKSAVKPNKVSVQYIRAGITTNCQLEGAK